jgi:hypothetical protein
MKEKDLKQIRQELSKVYKLNSVDNKYRDENNLWYLGMVIILLFSAIREILFVGIIGIIIMWLLMKRDSREYKREHNKLAKELEREGFELRKK